MGRKDAVPEDHPRVRSLRARERLVDGLQAGLTSQHGLIAHGRGEALDYLLGEETHPAAREAARAGAALLTLAERPVISVNGNVAALAPEGVVALASATGATIEVNLFHRDEDRVRAIAEHLREHGATDLLGAGADARLPAPSHDRAVVHRDGIAAADVVLVPLEDGDRAQALAELGKTEIVVDLNPLSRSARTAAVPICDDVQRALPLVADLADRYATRDTADLEAIVDGFDADAARQRVEATIRDGDLTGLGGAIEADDRGLER